MAAASSFSRGPSKDRASRPEMQSASNVTESETPPKGGAGDGFGQSDAPTPEDSKRARWLLAVAGVLWLLWMVFLVWTALRAG